jgi:precorrin-2 dehydrogenase/sirohydrochlorin ferrochelatase
MRYFPVFLDIQNRLCLVIGEGRLADEKAVQLECAGARVLRHLFFDPAQALQVFMIIAVVDTPGEGRRIRDFAEENGILVNVVDQTANCSFIAPAILERGDLSIAISTSGKCPALASYIRREMEKDFSPEYAAFLDFLATTRESIRKELKDFEQRRRFYREILEGGLLDTFREGGSQKAAQTISSTMDQFREGREGE